LSFSALAQIPARPHGDACNSRTTIANSRCTATLSLHELQRRRTQMSRVFAPRAFARAERCVQWVQTTRRHRAGSSGTRYSVALHEYAMYKALLWRSVMTLRCHLHQPRAVGDCRTFYFIFRIFCVIHPVPIL
jgi:hypothetical protein